MKQVTTYVGVDAHKKELFIAMLVGVGLIRLGGHLSKGEYDVQTDGRHSEAASAPPVHR